MTIEIESYRSTRWWAGGLSVLAAGMMVYTLYLVFFWVPTERAQGVVQRIYYMHVPSAWVAFIAFGIVAICSIGYLWLRDAKLDAIAVSAAELGTVFTTGVLVTGPIWGKIAWGTWWVWEPRLTLTLLLWLIYIGYFMVRGATENPEQGKRFGAVLGVVGAINIPFIHMSVQWFRSLHPQPVVLRPDGPAAAPEITHTVLMGFLTMLLVFFALLLYRYGLERMRSHVDALRYEAARASATTREGAYR